MKRFIRYEHGPPRSVVYEELEPPGAYDGEIGWAADSAGEAFHKAVVQRGQFGSAQYRIFPLEGSVGIAARVNLEATDEDGHALHPGPAP